MKRFNLDWEQGLGGLRLEVLLSAKQFEKFASKRGYKVDKESLALGHGHISTKGEFLNIYFKQENGSFNATNYLLMMDV